MRCERDFDAMIPPTLAGPTMPRPGLRESRRSAVFPHAIYPRQAGSPLAEADQAADVGRRRTPGAELAQAGGGGRFRELLPGAVENQPVVPVGRLRQAEQRLQQPMHAGRPEQVLAAHHLGHALQGVVDHHREVIAGRRLLAREDDVAPGFRPGGDRAGLALGTFAVLDPGRDRRRARRPPPYRAAALRRTRLKQSRALLAARAISPHRDRAARRRDRAAMGRSPRAARPVSRSRRGFRNSDRPGPGPKAFRARRDNRRDAGLPPHRLFPGDAEPGEVLDRSRSRIPACSGSGRYPRCAAGTGRRSAAPNRNSATPNRRGRDADSRSGSAQNGRRAAALISFTGHDGFKSQ